MVWGERSRFLRAEGATASVVPVTDCVRREPLPPRRSHLHPLALARMPEDAAAKQRRELVPAIRAAFERRTSPERAKALAEICYVVTEGTRFSPLDLAEIALAETGSHRLSSLATSCKGALGVWQIMPERAVSHGFAPVEMRDDRKCALAAVRELYVKLQDARGNLSRAKRLYCGRGRAAAAYDVQRRGFREEILNELGEGPRVILAEK